MEARRKSCISSAHRPCPPRSRDAARRVSALEPSLRGLKIPGLISTSPRGSDRTHGVRLPSVGRSYINRGSACGETMLADLRCVTPAYGYYGAKGQQPSAASGMTSGWAFHGRGSARAAGRATSSALSAASPGQVFSPTNQTYHWVTPRGGRSRGVLRLKPVDAACGGIDHVQRRLTKGPTVEWSRDRRCAVHSSPAALRHDFATALGIRVGDLHTARVDQPRHNSAAAPQPCYPVETKRSCWSGLRDRDGAKAARS